MKFCVVIEQDFGYIEKVVVESGNRDSAVAKVTSMYPLAEVRRVVEHPDVEQDN